MRFSLAAVAAFVPALVSAADITVTVGSGGLAYNPTSVTAAAGDNIIFQFGSGTHTVTQSTFENPCEVGGAGLNSGTFSAQNPTWTLRVNDTNPIWMHCAIGNHCSSGMVFAVNPSASGEQTFAAFQARAQGNTASTPSGTATTPASATGTSAGTATASATAPATNAASRAALAPVGLGFVAAAVAYAL